jgi:predicted MFS family arabinose efflux permease
MSDAGTTMRVTAPGAALIAVTFGLARYGYGLLLPEMRAELHIDANTAGLIASGSYVSYLAANTLVVWLTGRFGPRLPLALAALLAAAGMAELAVSRTALQLATGVLIAGGAAGLAFPPYADIVARAVPAPRRATSWSAISSGTGWGVALAAPVAIALGTRWRAAWLVFAGLALIAGVAAVATAPATRGTSTGLPRLHWAWFVCPRSGPLLVSAILIGAGSSVWWAFSVDAMRHAGVAETPARVVYAVCGAAGVLASVAGAASRRLGLRRFYVTTCLVLVVALALLGLGTASLAAGLVAAVLFGVSYNGVIAAQGLWNADVFRARPSAGLAAVNTALTIGTITGPAVAGLAIGSFGYPVTLLAAALTVGLAIRHAPPPAEVVDLAGSPQTEVAA